MSRPVRPDQKALADLRQMGVAVGEVQPEEEQIPVMAENWPILDLFLAVETQWKLSLAVGLSSAKTVWHGLDYAAVDVVMRRMGFGDRDMDAFRRLQIMETAALEVLVSG